MRRQSGSAAVSTFLSSLVSEVTLDFSDFSLPVLGSDARRRFFFLLGVESSSGFYPGED
jgi:hypothetical protein